MASYENANMLSFSSSSSMREEGAVYDRDHDNDDGFDRLYQSHNLSRLSVCTSSMLTNEHDDDGDDVGFSYDGGHEMSRLSIVSFEELSDVKKEGKINPLELLSDSDEEAGCYSLPATPPGRKNRGGYMNEKLATAVKEYASENEAQEGINITRQNPRKNLRERRIVRERWLNINSRKKEEAEGYGGMGQDDNYSNYGYCNGGSGESDGGGSGGVVVIVRAKGGMRPLCMDLDEVKACRDLGFELEHDRVELPGSVSLSGSTLDTSSGGNSPIANWRISSPGDDPRDVKARLKVWAQAVALASSSRQNDI